MTDISNQQRPVTREQENLIAILVLLLFGLLYWFFIHDRDPGVDEGIPVETIDVGAAAPSRLVTSDSSEKSTDRAAKLEAETAARHRSDAMRQKLEMQLQELQAAQATSEEAEAARLKAEDEARLSAERLATEETIRLKMEEEVQQLAEQVAAEKAAREQAEAARLKAEKEARRLTGQLAAEKASQSNLEADRQRIMAEAARQARLAEEKRIATEKAAKLQADFSRLQFALPGGETVTLQADSLEDKFKKAILNRQFNQPYVFDRIFLGLGSAELKDRESMEQIKGIAALLHAYDNINVSLRGHTDNTGNPQLNRALSLERSTNLKNALIDLGISEARIKTEGFGATLPIADNNTRSGRRKNRRIDIMMVE